MAQSLTCTGFSTSNGRARFSFGKRQRDFGSKAELVQWAKDQITEQVAEALLLLKLIETDPTLANPQAVVGRTVTLDFTLASNIVRVT